MKIWFVFNINGLRVAYWANNEKDAFKLLKEEYSEATDVKCLGCYARGIKAMSDLEPDVFSKRGMSPTDISIASGMIQMFANALRMM